jgi:hypothetical protein
MKEKQAFQWTPEVEAFQSLKEALSTASILAYLQPREVLRFIDMSNVRIGGMLSQMQAGQERVIAY